MKCATLGLLLAAALHAADAPKIAIVGLLHSHVWGHLEKVVRGEPARLVGVSETNPELIQEAKKAGVADGLFYRDPSEMLDKTRPDIVWAFLENNRHLEVMELCAPRKIHVMFEKPLAATFKEAQAVREVANRHGVYVLTNYQMAWWPANTKAKLLADAGEIGKPWRLHGIVGHGGPGSSGPRSKFFFEWLTDPVKNGGGAIIDFGCYNALWSLWYLGRPETVYAQVNHLRPDTYPKVEDNSTMILSYKDGVSILEGSWDLPRSFQDLEVFGSSGSLYMTRDRLELRKGREQAMAVSLAEASPEEAEPIAYLISCIRKGKAPSGLVGLDLNVEVMEILDAAKKSVQTGSAVRLGKRR